MHLKLLQCLLLVSATPVCADEADGLDELVPGHSHQGHAFNEGPRQATGLIGKTGDVHLPITTAWEHGQAYFDQGIGQLHGFWYFEAERSFRQIAANDPNCAMAYWGMAMANWENEARAKGFIEKASALTQHASPREQAYIKSQANYLDGNPADAKKRGEELLQDLDNLVQENPDDLEAKAFLVVRMWQLSRKGIPITSYFAADALMQQIFAKNPLHPAHHYRIHLWDKKNSKLALDSAATLGFTAPSIAHMWHMSGHIYSDLGRFADAAWHQQASARVDHAHMLEQRLLPDQIFNYSHNNEWLARNWIHLGNAPAALDMAQTLLSNPRHPKLNSIDDTKHSYHFGRQRLVEVLEKFELWEKTLDLAKSEWLEPNESVTPEVPRLRLIGLANFHLGKQPDLEKILAQLDDLIGQTTQKQQDARQAAKKKAQKEKKKPEEIKTLVKAAAATENQQIDQLKKTREELAGCLQALRGDHDAALKALDKSQRPKYAMALQYLALGNTEKADTLTKNALTTEKGQTLPLAARIEVLHHLGKTDEVRKAFQQLRTISSQIDLEAPPFARLLPIARSLEFEDDWRLPYKPAPDFGERPDQATLGPLHWTPPPAPRFTLPDKDGLPISLESYQGKPLILVFYLGHECLHCAQQLNALSDRFKDFQKANLPVLAVSTDAVHELNKTLADYVADGGAIPFPLVADPSKSIFRAYSAHDDFEGAALHGTFLIDPKGRILWSDIAADPFMDLDFLLKESRRLLGLHGG